jgi:hypothetical protein
MRSIDLVPHTTVTKAAGEASQGVENVKNSFSGVLQGMLQNGGLSPGLTDHINKVQQKLIDKNSFSPRELLLLQVQMGRFNLQVELVSKAAESVSSTFKRLQNG